MVIIKMNTAAAIEAAWFEAGKLVATAITTMHSDILVPLMINTTHRPR